MPAHTPPRGDLTEHLDLDDLLAAADAALGRPGDMRDIGLLVAAAARTGATVYGAVDNAFDLIASAPWVVDPGSTD